VLTGLLLAFLCAGSAGAATERVRYSPFDADGTLRDGLSVNIGGLGECTTGSFFVVGAFRCFEDNMIHDVCYRDDRDPEVPSLLCVKNPWARTAVRLQYLKEPDPSYGAKPGGRPWALELASGSRCVSVGGGTTVVGRLRLNYVCGRYGSPRARYLFGSPDRSRAVWLIRHARTFNGGGMRKVAIKVAWR
jgi:hypothetical protein